MSEVRYITEPPMGAEPSIDEIIRRADWYLEVDAGAGLAHHLKAHWPAIKAEITALRAERDAAIEQCAKEVEATDWIIPLHADPKVNEITKAVALMVLRQAAQQVRRSASDVPTETVIATDGKDAT